MNSRNANLIPPSANLTSAGTDLTPTLSLSRRGWRVTAGEVFCLLFLLLFPFSTYSFTVVIDAGHGGTEKGAVQGSLIEKDLSLRLARKIQTRLAKRPGIRAVMTRGEDRTLPIEERARAIAEAKADLFLSIHFNIDVFMLAETRGLEIYYPADDLAKAPEESLSLYHRNNRSFAFGKMMRDRYLKSELFTVWKHDLNMFAQRDLKIFRLTATPGLLLEIGYLTSPDDRAHIENEQFLDDMAAFIAETVVEQAGKK